MKSKVIEDMEGVPKSYYSNNILFANATWVQDLLDSRRVPPLFIYHPHFDQDEVEAYLHQANVTPLLAGSNDWEVFSVDRYPRQSSVVCPLPPEVSVSGVGDEGRCFADVLQYVSYSNFTNLWKEALINYPSAWNVRENKTGSVYGMEWDRALVEILQRVYRCQVVSADESILGQTFSSVTNIDKPSPQHVPSGLAIIVSKDEIFLLRPFSLCSIHQLMRFTPMLLEDSHLKPLFIVYQILLAASKLHSSGICIGDISLHDIFIDDDYLVQVRPLVVGANLRELKVSDFESCHDLKGLEPVTRELLASFRTSLASEKLDSNKSSILTDNFLGLLVQMWASGKMSNFDYIMLLNHLCGRTFSNPNHYPVLPWVRDFTSHVGGWRDLTKSKYRLNKGDTQLDLTYENVATPQEKDILSQPSCPHHVSDVLSEITYYVYKSRRTPKSVLCRHVRSRWVPAEYPSSMQRLQEWTPDESIPDFFTDPTIFSSIHDDLPDLGLPPWCSSAEDFIQWHRSSLESDQVSEKLHSWIDLTFGYKLSGSSAVRAKNVCLPLIDNHTDLRISGVVQLFNLPHPIKKPHSPFWSRQMLPRMDLVFLASATDCDTDPLSSEDSTDGSNTSPTIYLPKDYDPILPINDLDSMTAFASRSNSSVTNANEFSQILKKSDPEVSHGKEAEFQMRIERDMQVIGCIIMEIFLPKKFLTLGRHASLKSRYEVCLSLLKSDMVSSVAYCIREAVSQLLRPESPFDLEAGDRYPRVSIDGKPPPTPGQCLTPVLSPFGFPSYFSSFARLLRQLDDIDKTVAETRRKDVERWKENEITIMSTVAEMKVKLVASSIGALINEDLKSEDLNLILPCIKRLFKDKTTSVMAAWHLFEPVSKILGPALSATHFLESILRIYESGTPTAKHLKLYHRSFLLTLIVCFGMKIFLKYFTENVIEAVGGYKDFDYPPPSVDGREGLARNWGSPHIDEPITADMQNEEAESKAPEPKTLVDEFSEGEVFAFEEGGITFSAESHDRIDQDFDQDLDSLVGPIYVPSSYDDMMELWFDLSKANNNAAKNRSDGNISQIAAESVIWLAHRLGPVLTAKYLSRNLLKMLNLCYVGPKSFNLVQNDQKHPDSQIRICNKRTEGDALADNVLECLRELACLFGEQFILLQYLPYAWDLVSSCEGKKTLGWNVEGGLLGCLAMVRHCVTCLSDSVLMNELSENLLIRIFKPVLVLVTSPTVIFCGGWNQRQMLAYKLLDAIYMIGLRIGEEMARSLLGELCSDFFAAFDRVHASDGGEEHFPARSQLGQVLTADLAYAVYVTFFHLMGRAHLDLNIPNLSLLRQLCAPFNERNTIRVATFAHLRTATQKTQYDLSPGGSSSGNKIGVITSHYGHRDIPDLNVLIKKEISSTSRHLRGSWLAYWEHEIGKPEKSGFDLKQIKLQTFSGHSAGVRHIHVLDNENSFLSGCRDKTVKVWSVRSKGDGNEVLGPQWTYNMHKKSINSLTFLDGIRLAISCDSSIHIWDPFVGSGVHQIEGSATSRLGGSVSVLTSMSPFSSSLVVAATQHDGLLHLIDCRVGQVVTDIKVCIGAAGLVRCICTHPSDSNTVTVGHSSGFISQLDTRTGKLRQAWKGHEGEILTLNPLRGNDFVSTSLDQSVNVWEGFEAKLKATLPGPQEPIHCLATNGEEIITGSTSNRIVIRRGTSYDSPFTSNRLRPDILKGNLMSLKLLSMNRLLLLGTDTGNIFLVC